MLHVRAADRYVVLQPFRVKPNDVRRGELLNLQTVAHTHDGIF